MESLSLLKKTMNLDKELKNLKLKRVTAIHDKGHKWSVEKKIEVVTMWLAIGNLRLVSAATGVDYGLIRSWKLLPWWADLVAEIRASRDILVDNKLSKIVDKTLNLVEDRIDNGDIVYDRKSQEIVRKPLSAAVAHKIGNDLISRQIDISQKRVDETAVQKTEKIEDTLRLLAIEFARFNTRRTIDVEVKDVSDAEFTRKTEALETTKSREDEGISEGMEDEEPYLSTSENLIRETEDIFENSLSETSDTEDEIYQLTP